MPLAIARGGSGSGSGSGDKNYIHTQGVASATWVIHHNLGKFPSVTVVDSLKREWEGEVDYTDPDTLTIEFSAAFSGWAYLN